MRKANPKYEQQMRAREELEEFLINKAKERVKKENEEKKKEYEAL